MTCPLAGLAAAAVLTAASGAPVVRPQEVRSTVQQQPLRGVSAASGSAVSSSPDATADTPPEPGTAGWVLAGFVGLGLLLRRRHGGAQ